MRCYCCCLQRTFSAGFKLVLLGNVMEPTITVDPADANWFVRAAVDEVTKFMTGKLSDQVSHVTPGLLCSNLDEGLCMSKYWTDDGYVPLHYTSLWVILSIWCCVEDQLQKGDNPHP